MGADILDDEHYEGIEAVKLLTGRGKRYLSHHIRNSLQDIILNVERGHHDKVKEAVHHIVADLTRVGL